MVSVNVGQLATLPDLTATSGGAEFTVANGILIQIPAGVNAVWDQTVTGVATGLTLTPTGGTFAVNPTVTYTNSKTLLIAVTSVSANGNSLLIHGLKIIGNTGTTVAAALNWAVDGATYAAANANTQITVTLNGTTDVLTSLTAVAANDVINASTSYTVNFTIPAGGVITPDGKIVVTVPAGFDVTNATAGAMTGIDGAVAIVNNNGAHTMTLTRQGGVATNATAGVKSIVLNVIINQATAAANYAFTVATQISTGALLSTANTANFSVVSSDPVSTLSCISSGSGGAIWLRWTVPTGAAGAYTVKYSLATINAGNFAAATTFTQAWATGAVGQANQQLVNALTPNNVYFFNLKVAGTDAGLSAVSNTVYCTAPTSAGSTGSTSGLVDSTPPTSSVTDPTVGQGILAGAAYTIKGTSSDTGGSSVVKVEVSTDGGTTWIVATPVTTSGTGYTWQYAWTPSIGSYTIKSRATDGYGNVETPSAGIAVTVGTASTLPSVTVTTGGTTTTTPASSGLPYASPVGATQIQANITYLQTQLLSLLQQLLALLQAGQ